jgi:RNA 2',3'-cyclic 3'-phosphodiesterase
MFRLFIAIDLPADVKEKLMYIGGGVPGARWLEQDQLHLTVRFIGEVDGGVFDDILNALKEVRSEPFEMKLKGVGHFPPRKDPEVIWVGVEKNDHLLQLRNRVESALSRVGIERDKRKFAPHIAIARLRNTHASRVGWFISEYALFELEPFPVTEFNLYTSVLSSNGAQYQLEANYQLIRNGYEGIDV